MNTVISVNVCEDISLLNTLKMPSYLHFIPRVLGDRGVFVNFEQLLNMRTYDRIGNKQTNKQELERILFTYTLKRQFS